MTSFEAKQKSHGLDPVVLSFMTFRLVCIGSNVLARGSSMSFSTFPLSPF